MDASYDYIIVGGGLAGCVVASRLHEKLPSASILVIEAGGDQTDHPFTPKPLNGVMLHKSDLDWNLETVPQPNLGGRACYQGAGKALGGGTAINYGTWTRGPKVDYDRWAALVNDEHWSYDQLLPYFPKTQTRAAGEDLSEQSRQGLIFTATPSQSHPDRNYPLRDPVREAWDSAGVKFIPDANSGSPLGLSERVENWNQGKRQFAYHIYSLDGVKVLTHTRVQRIIITDNKQGEKVATGVELLDGEVIHTHQEVILSAGTYHSPQLLLLSGIGPAAELEKHDIAQLVDSPEVGHNFYDHTAVPIAWELKQREQYLPFEYLMKDPVMSLGWASDWVVFSGLEPDTLRKAITADGGDLADSSSQLLLEPGRCFTETLNFYVPAGTAVAEMDTPMDGSCISSVVLGMSPTSVGSISLASKDPLAPPVINPNYYATEVDRAAIRAAVRKALFVYQETDALKDIIECEAPPQGYPPLCADSTDEEIDHRVRRVGISFFHPTGSCSMGKVVDCELRVYGVKGLRVVDASVLPTSIAAHLQDCIYALANRAADFIAG